MFLFKRTCLVLLALLFTMQLQAQDLDVQAGLGLHSQYVAQGRSLLPGGDLAQFDLLFEGQDIYAGLTHLDATDTGYSETQWLVGYAYSLGRLDLDLSLTHLQLRVPGADDTDNEIGAGLSYNLGDFTPFAVMTYSTGASAAFFDLGIAKDIDVGIGEISPYLMSGWNQGYIAGESEGLNHIQLGLDYSLSLSEMLDFTAYIAASQPLNQDAGDTTNHHYWGGVGISYSF